jgi:integrase
VRFAKYLANTGTTLPGKRQMARTTNEAEITTAAARAKLEPHSKPYWRDLVPGVLRIGVRQGKRGGAWVAGIYRGRAKYDTTTFAKTNPKDKGTASEIDPAKVTKRSLLTYRQAVKVAEWLHERDTMQAGAFISKPLTVREAVEAHIEWQRVEGKSAKVNEYFAGAHIYDQLGDIEVERLTTDEINAWLKAVAESRPRRRSRKGKPPAYGPKARTADQKRARRDTANRVFKGVLAPALESVFQDGKVSNNAAWKRVRPFKKTTKSRKSYLTHGDCTRLLNTCPPDLRALVQGALLTGARYGELCNLDVSDWHGEIGKLHVRESKSGNERYITVNDAARKFFDQLTIGRKGAEPLFKKTDGTRWRPGHQTRPFKAAVGHAKISPSISFHGLRHTYCSLSIMAGTPLHVMAENLGHTTTRMVEVHYGHLREDYKDAILRETTPTFEVEDTKIARMGA